MLNDILIYKEYVIEVSAGRRGGFYGDIYYGGGLKQSLGRNPSKGGCVSECMRYIDYFISEEK